MTPHTIGKNPLQIGKLHLQGVIFCRNFASTKEIKPTRWAIFKSQRLRINKVINTLNQVNGQEFMKREVIDNNIIKNTYENEEFILQQDGNTIMYLVKNKKIIALIGLYEFYLFSIFML